MIFEDGHDAAMETDAWPVDGAGDVGRPFRTVKMTVEYDGTDFVGFQAQGGEQRTVQSVLEEGVSRIVDHRIALHAAGRTDTGVHALGQVVSFRTTGAVPIGRLAIAVNSVLPIDVSVASAEEVDHSFHARYSAKSRTYGYLVWTRRTRSALWARYSLHLRRPLDVQRMRDAGNMLVGTRNFAAFAKTGGSPGPSTVRRLDRLSIRRIADDRVLFVVSANGFLRTMVRNIVGALIEVGTGDLEPGTIRTILQTEDRVANPCAPAAPQGLCLLRVDY
jgi:tRNA pseudouridine38-40 synthase